MRMLIVTHAPLSPEFGAGQMAINLAEAFRNLGEDVTLWSPYPLPEKTKSWQSLQKMRSKLDEFIQTQKPFDVIDIPAAFITSTVRKYAPIIVARSVQPDLLYLFSSNEANHPQYKSIFKVILSYFYKVFFALLIVQGWWKANFILCLGSLELAWMQKWFPWWKGKLSYYVNALSNSDKEALASVRKHRQKPLEDKLQFLWIGRWVSHKGPDILLNFIEEWLAKRPQDIFTIAGSGAEVEKDLPLELLRAGQIKIVPYFERNQLFSLLADHDIGLFTSKVEGWGLVLNEMLESGMPVLATNAGGVPDLQRYCRPIKPFSSFLLPIPKSFLMIFLKQEEYYGIFCWNKIAETYKNTLLKSEKTNKMKKIVLQDNWPDSWKYSYGYDLLEIYGEMSNRGYAYAYANRRQQTLELIQKVAKPGSKVLDVAAAQGNFSLALAELGYEVTWNDLREELVDYVKLKKEKGIINYAPGNILTLNFDSFFDVILIAEVIEHVAHPDEFLKKISQMVKPGGYIVMSTPNGKYFRNHLPKFSEFAEPSQFEEIEFQPDADGHIFLLHPDEVHLLAKNADLLLIEMQLLTNPLTAGYFKLGRLLKVLPPVFINSLEEVYQKLPTFLVEKLSTCLIALLARPAESSKGALQ